MNPSPALLSLVQKWRDQARQERFAAHDIAEGAPESARKVIARADMKYQLADELSAHLPALAVLVEQHEAMRNWILKCAEHGIAGEHENGEVEYCRGGQYDRTLSPDGTPGEYPCVCGLDSLRAALDTKARGPNE